MDVFDLFAKLGLDTSEYEKGLSDAETKGSGFGKGLASAAKVGVAAVAAVGTAAIAAGTSLVKNAGEVAEYGDNIDKMSQKVGMSAKAYQEWDYVMKISGTEMSSMTTGLKTLTNKLDDAKGGSKNAQEMFQKLGLSMSDLKGMSREEVFGAVITGFQGMADSTERAALANDLFGKSGQELAPLFNTSAEETQKLIKEVNDLGGVMSDDAVKASAAYQDQLTALTTSFSGLKNNLMSNFLPAITTVMGGLTDLFSGDYDKGLDEISKGVSGVVDNLMKEMPKILSVGASIIEAIGESILTNIPTILPALVDLVMSIATMIIDNLPLLIQTGLDIILELSLGIAKALPDLIPTIVDVILTIVDTLIDNIDLLVDAAIAIITGLAEGLIKALPKLIEKAPEIIKKLVDALIKNIPKIIECAGKLILELAQGLIKNLPQIAKAAGEIIGTLVSGIAKLVSKVIDAGKNVIEKFKEGLKKLDPREWGKDLLNNFIQGIKDKIGDLKETCSDIGKKIKDLLGFSEPKEGPLSNFHTFAPDMMDLFIKGVKDNTQKLQDQIGRSFNFGDAVVNANVNTSSGAGNTGNVVPITINVYGAEGQNVKELADKISDVLMTQMRRAEAVYA